METKRDARGNRICRKCGETLGINLGTQRRHDEQKHAADKPKHSHTELTEGCFTCLTVATVGY